MSINNNLLKNYGGVKIKLKRKFSLLLVALMVLSLFPAHIFAITNNNETTILNNVVVYANFRGDTALTIQGDEYNHVIDTYNANDQTSLSGYMKTISYGQMEVRNIFPQSDGEKIVPIQLSMSLEDTRGEYFDNQIVSEIIDALEKSPTPSGLDSIHNLTVILQGGEGLDFGVYPTIWPHQYFYNGGKSLYGHNIRAINMLNTDVIFDILSGVGVVAHEFLHTLNYADLYTGSSNTSFVDRWDIMSVPDIYMFNTR